MQQTNQPSALNFAGLLAEGLPYVDSWTPTMINEGGCGVFASLLSKELNSHGIEHKIYALFYNHDWDFYRENFENFLKTGNITDKSKTGVNHICILVNDTLYVDSTGIINREVAAATAKIEMTLNQLDDLNNRGGWNDTFDRKCIPFIADHIKEIFSHLDDFHSGMFKYPGNDEVTLTRHTLQARRGMGDLFELLSSSIR